MPLDLLSTLVVVGLHRLDQLGQRGPVVGVHVGDARLESMPEYAKVCQSMRCSNVAM